MSEREVVSECNDEKMTTDADMQGFKLPKIQNPRPSVRSRVEHRQKKKSLNRRKNQFTTSQDRSKVPGRRNKLEIKLERDQFTLEIEQKLKHVLQNVKSGKQGEGLSDIEEQDFEDAVRYNRQMIKMQKKQTKMEESPIKRQSPPKMTQAKKSSRALLPKEKKVKQYTETSQHKILQKRKELLLNQKSKNLVRKIERLNSHRQPPRPKQGKSDSLSKMQSVKGLTERKISANLFDNIHGLLQNPKNRSSSVMGKANKKTIQQLQKQIRVINQKLGVGARENTKETEEAYTVRDEATTVRDWKRIEIARGANFNLHGNSSFEKEMDKITELQDKNHGALNYYIEHQKILVELGLIKKLYPKIERRTE